MTDKPSEITPEAELLAETKIDNAKDPWIVADKKGVQLDTPMDSKTIKNAILKRLPEVKRIQLIGRGDKGDMAIVCICEIPNEKASILIEDAANIFMRHKDLMNIVDNFYLELRARKRGRKSNQLPGNFFRSGDAIDLSKHG